MAIYFIQAGAGGPIKIGFTESVQQRLSKIMTDCPPPVALIGLIDKAPVEVERFLHKRFAAHRIDREWFKPHPEVIEYALGYAPPESDDLPKWDTPLGRWMHKTDTKCAALAEALGCSAATLSRILNEVDRPGWDLLAKIAEVTGGEVMPNDFLRIGAN